MEIYHFENKRFEVLENVYGDCIIKDKTSERYYYKKDYLFFEKNGIEKNDKVKWNWRDVVVLSLIILSVICMLIVLKNIELVYEAEKIKSAILLIDIYLFTIFNIIIHECAHSCMMIFYGRRPGKLKFKFYCKIFPYIVIDTSDSYMLLRYRKAFVYYAGIMVNWIVCGSFTCFFLKYVYLISALVWVNIYNMIPFGGIKTDGYRILMDCILNKKELKSKKSRLSKILELAFWIMAIIYTFKSWSNFFKDMFFM